MYFYNTFRNSNKWRIKNKEYLKKKSKLLNLAQNTSILNWLNSKKTRRRNKIELKE